MYFWRIEKLKAAMAARPLSEREVLPYLIASIALSTAVSYLPQTSQNIWDTLGSVWSVLLVVMGSLYIYRQNGGANGQHFLQRYFAIGWVVTLRWLVLFLAIGAAFYGTLAMVGAETEETAWHDFLFLAIAEAVVYWRIGHQVRDLAQKVIP